MTTGATTERAWPDTQHQAAQSDPTPQTSARPIRRTAAAGIRRHAQEREHERELDERGDAS